MKIPVERPENRLPGQRFAEFGVDVDVDVVLRLALGQVVVVVAGQQVHPVGLIPHARGLNRHVGVVRWVRQDALPERVHVRRVAHAPEVAVGHPIIRHTTLHWVALGVVAPLWAVRHHHTVRITTQTTLQRFEHVLVDLPELVEHREAGLQREQTPHVVGVIQTTEQHLALNIVELQEELVLRLQERAGKSVREPFQEVGDAGVSQLLSGVSHPDTARSADAVAAWRHALGVVENLDDPRRGLGRTHGPAHHRQELLGQEKRHQTGHRGVLRAHR